MYKTSPDDSRSEHPSLGKERPDPEVHILGSIMGDPALLEYVAPRIKPEWFRGELHARIYRAMLYKHEHGISPNLQCLSLEARPSGLLENVARQTLLDIAQSTATTAYIDHSVKRIVKRYKQRELDGPRRPGRAPLEKQKDVSQIIETLTAALDDLERRHETLASLDPDGSQFSRLATRPRPALVGTKPLPAVDTRPQGRLPRGAAEVGSFARLGHRVAKPLAVVSWIVGAGLLSWFAGRWSAMVVPMTSTRAPVVAPLQDPSVHVASEVVSNTARGAKPEELAPQQTKTAPVVVPPAVEPPQVSQEAIQPSAPVAPSEDTTPRALAPAPRRAGGWIYAVNVSSFRNAAAAAVEVARLQARGYQARAIRTDLESKGVWYRVYIGQYGTEAEAKQARAGILAHTHYRTAFVRSIALF